MSTYWGYRCTDCNVDTDTWINHGERELSAIIRHWPVIRAIAEDPNMIYLNVTWIAGYEGELFEFLYAHGEHSVCLQNEYGDSKPLIPPDDLQATP